MNNFDKWFKKQFGKVPNTRELLEARLKVGNAFIVWSEARFDLKNLEILTGKYEAALYARNAFEKKGENK